MGNDTAVIPRLIFTRLKGVRLHPAPGVEVADLRWHLVESIGQRGMIVTYCSAPLCGDGREEHEFQELVSGVDVAPSGTGCSRCASQLLALHTHALMTLLRVLPAIPVDAHVALEALAQAIPEAVG